MQDTSAQNYAAMRATSDEEGVSASEQRKRAFEVNFLHALCREMGASRPNQKMRDLAERLAATHEHLGHMIEARTKIRFGRGKWYVVLQTGLVRKRGADETIAPYAERVLDQANVMLSDLDPRWRRAVVRAIEKAEIARRHPFDVRRVWSNRFYRAYLTLIAGPDRRSGAAMPVTKERRAPQRPTVGLLIFVGLISGAAALGAALILGVAAALSLALSQDSQAWQTILRLTGLGDP